MQRLFAELNKMLYERFAKSIIKLNECFAGSNLNLEHHIIGAELRQVELITTSEHHQDEGVAVLNQVVGQFKLWRQDTEGFVDDLRIEVGKLTKYWISHAEN